MRKLGLVAIAACFFMASLAVADTVVPAGSTLTVTNTEDLGFGPVQLGAGATLAFAGGDASSAGLNEYTRSGATGLGAPGVTDYGTWTRIATNAFWAGTNITAASTEYIYTGRWLIPEAGVYSFYEHIDDAALIAVDGVALVKNGAWNVETCTRDVSLGAGWHDLEIRVQNGAAGGGIANAALKSGILYSPSNDLISVANQTNAFPFADPGDGSVLRAARTGCLMQKTLIEGEASFDLTSYDMAAPFRLIGGLIPLTNGVPTARLTVNGQGELTFGAAGLDVNYPPFNADVAFSNAASVAGVTFCDQSTVYAWPTSCAWRVASGATLALAGTNLLGDGDVTLTNHNLYVLGQQSVAEDATIHVQGTNLTVTVKPCSLDPLGTWYGAASTITNDISLEGSGSTLLIPVNADCYIQGKITGTGTVYKTGSARAHIKEASSVVGDIICNQTIFIFEATTAGDSNNTVTVNANGAFALYPPGYGTLPTEAWIKTLKGNSTSGKLYVPKYQTMVVDQLEGSLSLEGGGSALHIHTLGSNAVVSVIGTLDLTIDTLLPGASITLASPATTLAISGSGNVLDSLVLTTGAIPVSGAFTIGQLGGAGTLVKRGAETMFINFSSSTNNVQVDDGTVRLERPDSGTVLGNLPAFWLDASATNVFKQYKSYVFTNNFMVISNWFDCRPGVTVHAYNDRGQDNYQVYPYVMTSNQNNRSVVSFGSYEETLSPDYGSRTEARRIYFSTGIYPQYAVMVFGSQKGGGASLLGGNIAFQRGGSTTADYRNPATPIFAATGANYPVWTNGVSVTATNTGYSGGYQIVTVNTKGALVNALGWKLDYTTAGGQNYGEILFFTNTLTTAQRVAAEVYLARKWDLPYTYAAFPAVTVGPNGTLVAGANVAIGALYGSGHVTVADTDSVQFSGLFSGTITLAGGTLTLPGLHLPPGSECVPEANRSGWFDPDQTNRVVFGGTFTPTRPLTIAALYDRTSTNQYLLGTCRPDLSTAYDRRPWLSATNGPTGAQQYWIDYGNPYGDTQGNTLRLNRNPSYIGTETISPVPTNVQSGFIVLDSSRGGGIPIIDTVTANGAITRDNSKVISSPIWGSATTNILKNGATYLDGLSVNGATTGYRGMNEVLSFTATDSVKASYFGYYGNSDGTTLGTERLGEIILFDAALSDPVRADIEAYLMKKWCGRARDGYSDLTAATVTGTGSVSAPDPARLPAFDPAFAGTVALTASAFDFTVTTNASGATVVFPATVIPGTLSVPAVGSVQVHFAVKPHTGVYPLVTYGAAAGSGFTGWSLSADGAVPPQKVVLTCTPTALNLYVVPSGTLLRIL